MMIRNIKSPIMMNGTRAIISNLGKHIVEVTISSGEFKDQKVILPRIKFVTDEIKNSFSFTRLWFPLKLCFAMTINKS